MGSVGAAPSKEEADRGRGRRRSAGTTLRKEETGRAGSAEGGGRAGPREKGDGRGGGGEGEGGWLGWAGGDDARAQEGEGGVRMAGGEWGEMGGVGFEFYMWYECGYISPNLKTKSVPYPIEAVRSYPDRFPTFSFSIFNMVVGFSKNSY